MSPSRVGNLIPAALALVAVVLLAWWLGSGPAASLEVRVPGLDRPAGTGPAAEGPEYGKVTRGPGVPGKMSGAWPEFRGPRRDGIGDDGTPLARSWPKAGPPKLWSVELGEGYAGPIAAGGCVYIVDYDRDASSDAVRCLSLTDGKEIWRFAYPVSIKRNHGMSRTVPALSGESLIALGPKCHVSCLDPASGNLRWGLSLVEKYRSAVPPWYAGQCPLIDGDRVILAPGGDALVIAVETATGRLVWKSPNPRGWSMTHASIVPMEFAGQKMYVYCGSGGVAGASAADGRILWDTTDWKISIATVPSPVALPEGRIFFSGGYSAGAMLMQLKEQGQKITTSVVRRLKASEFGSTQHTPILYENHLYGVREKDKQLVCLDLQGKVLWSSGSEHRFGLGPYLIADKLIYVLDDSGKLTLVEASPARYRQLAEAQVLDGHDAWGPMALVGGRLLLRDFTQLVCLDVSKR